MRGTIIPGRVAGAGPLPTHQRPRARFQKSKAPAQKQRRGSPTTQSASPKNGSLRRSRVGGKTQRRAVALQKPNQPTEEPGRR